MFVPQCKRPSFRPIQNNSQINRDHLQINLFIIFIQSLPVSINTRQCVVMRRYSSTHSQSRQYTYVSVNLHSPATSLPEKSQEPGPARDMGAPRAQQKFGAPSNRYFSTLFGIGQGWRTFLRAHAQNANNIRRNYFTFGHLSSLEFYFRLLQ